MAGRLFAQAEIEKEVVMDWPFETYIMRPLPMRVKGIAEIAGNRNGFWEVRDIWIQQDGNLFRAAGHDERKQIELSLQMMAGGKIGKAYRDSLLEPEYEHC